MFPAVSPGRVPALFGHPVNKLFSAATVYFGLQDSHGTFCNVALFGSIDQEIIFIFLPGDDVTFHKIGPIKMLSLLRGGKTSCLADLVCKFFLFFQIMFGLMEFSSVNV